MLKPRSFLIILVLFTTITATAQTSFIIERVDINPGARVRLGIIRAEARLRPGSAYTAEQLDQALYRIRRLPFVVSATYTLEPGSVPTSRVMKVNLLDQHAFNFNLSLDVLGIRGTGGATSVDSLGWTFFAGPTGVLDVAAGGDTFVSNGPPGGSFEGLTLHYTVYGLFGTGAYAAVGIGSKAGLNPSFVIGVPLGLTQTLRGTYQRQADGRNTSMFASADWLSDRTDDPYLPRRGLVVSVGPEKTRQAIFNEFNVGTRFFFRDDETIDRNGLAVEANQYRPLAQHSALWGRGLVSRFDESRVVNGNKPPDVHETNAEVLIGLAHNFDRGMGDVDLFRRGRLEGGIGYRYQNRQSSAPGFRQKDRGVEVSAGFSYRSQWGILHLTGRFVAD